MQPTPIVANRFSRTSKSKGSRDSSVIYQLHSMFPWSHENTNHKNRMNVQSWLIHTLPHKGEYFLLKQILVHFFPSKMYDSGQHCGALGKVATCNAGILYGFKFVSWLLRFWSSFLPVAWEQPKCLGPGTHVGNQSKLLVPGSWLQLTQPWLSWPSKEWTSK